MSELVFSVRHTLYETQVSLGAERLAIKTSYRLTTLAIADLQHLYVTGGASARDLRELLLSVRRPRGGLRRHRIHADPGDPGFDALVATLVARRPEIDIRHLGPAEALRMMGTREFGPALPRVMGLGLLIVAAYLAPLLAHGFDGGHAEVTVEALAAGEPHGTRNVRVRGAAQSAYALATRTGPHLPPEMQVVYVPLVSPEWTPAVEVSVVLEVRGALAFDPSAAHFDGMIRDLAWEGFPARRRRDLEAKGIRLAERVRLVELGADPGVDRALALTLLGFLGALWIGVMLALRLRRGGRARAAAPAAASPGRSPDEGEEMS